MKTSNTKISIIFLILSIFLGFSFYDDSPKDNIKKESKILVSKTQIKDLGTNQLDGNGGNYQTFGSPYYTDNFDGANDTNSLKARGYKIYYRGSGIQGISTWFQGSPSAFPAFNGPTSGYVAANYQTVTGTNNIDNWLVLPKKNAAAGDSLFFYSRSPLNSVYPDSIRVMYSYYGDSIPESYNWVELERFRVNTSGSWERKGFRVPYSSSNTRFAIRYNVVSGGPSGSNSDYIGIDALTIETSMFSNDVGTLSINSPLGNIALPSPTIAPKATFKNFGTYSQNNIPVTYKITGPVNYTSNKTISFLSSGVSAQIIFDSTFNPVIGNYNISVYSSLPTDGNRYNDTLKTTFNVTNPNFGYGAGYNFANSTATQAPSYPNYCWVDTAGSHNLILNGVIVDTPKFSGTLDDGVFKYRYSYDALDRRIRTFDQSHDSIFIGTNGIIAFNYFNPGNGSWDPPSGGIPNGNVKNAIYPFWKDLDFGDPDVPINRLSYKIMNNGCIVTYDRVCIYGGGSTDHVSFQVQIELIPLSLTSDSRIRINYSDSTAGKTGIGFINRYNNNTLSSHLIGFQDSLGLNALTYRFRNSSSIIYTGPIFGASNNSLSLAISTNQHNLNYACSNSSGTAVTVSPNSQNYSTLSAAFTAINTGAHGSVALTVTINENTIESSSATLNGNTFASCLIKPSGSRIVSGNFNDAIIVLNGADNVTIDGLNTGGNSLTLTNTNIGINQGCIRLSNGAQNNVIKNLTCNGTGTASTGGKTIYVAESITAIGNNNNIIENNIINGGNRGIQTFGTSYLVTNDGTIIRNNIIKNIASIGIFIGSETRNNTVQGNKIYFDVFFTVDHEFRAINIQGVGTNQITTNKIYGISNNANHDLYGIISIPVILTAPGSSITTVNIVNNFISIANDNPFTRNIYGIRISSISAPYTANVYFNSVLISGNGSNVNSFTSGIIVNNSLSGSNTIVKNNIFRNNRSGGNSSARHTGSLYVPYSGSSISADYNISIATDSIRGYNSGWNGSLYNEMNEYRQAACDPNINELHTVFWNKFSFVSSNDLHLIDSTIMGSFNATPIPGITTDIDGDLRKSDAPYRGADELQDTFIVLNLGVAIQGAAPPNASVITVQFFRNSPPYDVIAQSTEVIDQSRTSGGIVPVVMRFHPILLLLAFPPLFDVYTDGVIPVFGLCEESMGWLLGLLHCEKLQSAFQLEAEYDFTTSISKAYGNNQIMYAGLASLYNGDVNNDGVIDASDLALIDNDASNFLTGNYLVNDITRDGIVDGVDLSIADNNAYNFVAEISPIPQDFSTKDKMLKGFYKTNRSGKLNKLLLDSDKIDN